MCGGVKVDEEDTLIAIIMGSKVKAVAFL